VRLDGGLYRLSAKVRCLDEFVAVWALDATDFGGFHRHESGTTLRFPRFVANRFLAGTKGSRGVPFSDKHLTSLSALSVVVLGGSTIMVWFCMA
jgi:hypothetical protein